MDGYLQLDGWHGRTQQKVEIVSETPQKVRIRAITTTRLAGRRRSLLPGEMALVPKYAVRHELAAGVELTN